MPTSSMTGRYALLAPFLFGYLEKSRASGPVTCRRTIVTKSRTTIKKKLLHLENTVRGASREVQGNNRTGFLRPITVTVYQIAEHRLERKKKEEEKVVGRNFEPTFLLNVLLQSINKLTFDFFPDEFLNYQKLKTLKEDN